jgi:hypothetical protein
MKVNAGQPVSCRNTMYHKNSQSFITTKHLT